LEISEFEEAFDTGEYDAVHQTSAQLHGVEIRFFTYREVTECEEDDCCKGPVDPGENPVTGDVSSRAYIVGKSYSDGDLGGKAVIVDGPAEHTYSDASMGAVAYIAGDEPKPEMKVLNDLHSKAIIRGNTKSDIEASALIYNDADEDLDPMELLVAGYMYIEEDDDYVYVEEPRTKRRRKVRKDRNKAKWLITAGLNFHNRTQPWRKFNEARYIIDFLDKEVLVGFMEEIDEMIHINTDKKSKWVFLKSVFSHLRGR
jgi:hypothetical protein